MPGGTIDVLMAGLEVRMLRPIVVLLLAAVATGISGCGAGPAETPQRRTAEAPPASPIPMPTRISPSTGFEAARIPERFTLAHSGSYWVQLNDPGEPGASLVVGIEPRRSGGDLEAAVEMQRAEMDAPRDSRFRETGTVESEVLGEMRWTWSTFEVDEVEMHQLALFGAHPTEGCLVIARSEYPAGSADRQTKLDELVAVTGIIAPGL
jgi:hypothetical protein